MVYDFSIDQVCWAASVAMRRHASATIAGRNPYQTRNERRSVLDDHFLGIMGEFTVSTHFGLDFEPTIDTFKTKPDVCGFEVRCSRGGAKYLILSKRDRPDSHYVWVLQRTLFKYEIMGAIDYATAWDVAEPRKLTWSRDEAMCVEAHQLTPLKPDAKP